MSALGLDAGADRAPAPLSAGPRRRLDLRKLDRRGRLVLGAATAAAVLVNAAVGWAYWSFGVPEAGRTGPAVELTVQGHSGAGRPLRPGSTTDLTVTVANGNPFPVRIVTVRPVEAGVVADAPHRDAGCRSTGVSVAGGLRRVSWDVPEHTVGVFTFADGMRMVAHGDPACLGAVFFVPIEAVQEMKEIMGSAGAG